MRRTPSFLTGLAAAATGHRHAADLAAGALGLDRRRLCLATGAYVPRGEHSDQWMPAYWELTGST